MFSRMRDSIVYPQTILQYKNDKLIYVFLYIMLFALLMTTRISIDTIRYDGLSYSYQEFIKEEVTYTSNNCAIEDAVLSCDTNEREQLFQDANLVFYLDTYDAIDQTHYDSVSNAIILHNEEVLVVVFGYIVQSVPYSDLPDELHNLEFDAINSDSPNDFYNPLFQGLDSLLVETRIIWGPMFIGLEFISSLILFLLFVLISSWFMRIRYKEMPFKEIFIVTTYTSTALFIILIFNNLIELNFFLLILLIIVAFRQNNLLAVEIEKQRMIKMKQEEEKKKQEQDQKQEEESEDTDD